MNENAIDRKLVCAFIAGLISDDGERRKGLEYIRSMPPVTPQQKIGHWISKPHIYGVAFCSECDFELKINDTNYCPNCGAKMVEPQERSDKE